MSSQSTAAMFSVAHLREWACGDEDLVIDLITIFLRIGPPMVLRLEDALAAANNAAIAQEAHDLKGCLALLGAEQASANCARVEAQARRSGACPSREDAEALCVSLDRIVREVQSYAAALPACQ